MAISLLIGAHHEPSAIRVVDYRHCLSRNVENSCIERVWVFLDDTPGQGTWAEGLLGHRKIRVVPGHNRRLSFAAGFAHANAAIPRGEVAVLANADIEFDETLRLCEGAGLDGALFCLSRWEPEGLGWVKALERGFPRGQDAWVWRSPIPAFPCDWPLGQDHCDYCLAAAAARCGLTVSDPSLSIVIRHWHASRIRSRDKSDVVRGEHLYLKPTLLPTLEARVGGPDRDP